MQADIKPEQRDLKTETLVTLSEGKKLLQQAPPTYRMLRRWIDHGLRSHGENERVYLEGIQIGGTTYTSVEAFHRFLDKLNGTELA